MPTNQLPALVAPLDTNQTVPKRISTDGPHPDTALEERLEAIQSHVAELKAHIDDRFRRTLWVIWAAMVGNIVVVCVGGTTLQTLIKSSF